MRTTLDISDELMKKAKIHAVMEGITLKELFTRLLEKEVGDNSEKVQKSGQNLRNGPATAHW